jgi:hypothetical protein
MHLDRNLNTQSISLYNLVNRKGNLIYEARLDTDEKSYDRLL